MMLLAAVIAWLLSVGLAAGGIRPIVALPLALTVTLALPASTGGRRLAHAGAAGAIVLFAAWHLGSDHAPPPPDSIGRRIGESVHVLARADSDGDPHPTYVAAYAKVTASATDGVWTPTSGGVRLLFPASFDARQGDVFDVRGPIEAPGGASDGYTAWLRRRGVVATLAFPTVKLVSRSESATIESLWRSLRTRLDGGLASALPATDATFAAALLFGGHHALPRDVNAELSATGATHLVVVSAFNLMLLYGAVSAGLAPFVGRRRSTLVGAALSLVYGIAAGQSAAVQRGEIIVVLLTLASLSGRPFSKTALLALAAAAMTLIDPPLVSDAGFQLTFAAAAGIAIVAPRLMQLVESPLVREGRRLPGPIRVPLDSAVIGLAVSAATVPVSVATFGSLSLVAPLVNAVVNPFIPLVMLLTLVTGVVGSVAPWLAVVTGVPLWLALRAVEAVLRAASGLPGAAADVRAPALPFTLAWYTAFVVADLGAIGLTRRLTRTERRTSRRKPPGRSSTGRSAAPAPFLACAVFLIAAPVAFQAFQSRSQATTITWLAGTGGEGELVTGRNGARILVTSSESPLALAQALQAGGVSGVDVVVATSGGDTGWARVAEAVHASTLLLPAAAESDALRQDRAQGRTIVPVAGEARIDLGGADQLDWFTSGKNAVVRVTLGGQAVVLYTGSATEVLARWQQPVSASVLVEPIARVRDSFAATAALGPRVLVAVGRDVGSAPAVFPRTASPVRVIEASRVRALKLTAQPDRIRIEYRDP